MEQYVEKIEIGFGAFLVAIKDGDKPLWGMIDKDGYEIVPCEYDEVRPGYNFDEDGNLFESYNLVKKNGLWGILHEHWKVDFIFEEIGEFHLVGPDFAEFPVAKYNGFWGVGFPNNAIVPFVYDYIGHFTCDAEEVFRDSSWAVAQRKGKWGVLMVKDEKCSDLVPFIYDSACLIGCESDSIAVKKDGLWGIIDHEGHQVVPFIYEDAEEDDDGNIKVKFDGEWRTIGDWWNEVENSDEEPEDGDKEVYSSEDPLPF